MRTQVGIVGAGPAGLVLGQLLRAQGIDSVVLENRPREHVEARVRAGVLEDGTVDILHDLGVDARLRAEGLVHHGIELRFDRAAHRIPMSDLTGGKVIVLYGQQEVVKDLVAARLDAGDPLLFDVSDVGLDDIDTAQPKIRFEYEGRSEELHCDIIAGCDGFHGVSRDAIPASALTTYQREYPFAWLGILAAVPPAAEELIYTYTDRGFALLSMRSPQVSRLYLQVDPTDTADQWPDDRVWEELHTRLAMDGDWKLDEGPVLEKSVTAMRSFVAEPMRHGRLFLAGDAAHIVPPTGAKGLNLAVADAALLADAIASWYRTDDASALDTYSSTALRRVWRAQHFAGSMTSMLHRYPGDDPYRVQMQLSQLRYTASSQAAATSLAENYVGLAIR